MQKRAGEVQQLGESLRGDWNIKNLMQSWLDHSDKNTFIMEHTSLEGFSVTLPSNASKELFKYNTSSCYTFGLAKPIELRGEWLVGLCEFIYPRTWYNLPKDKGYVELNRTGDCKILSRRVLQPS